MDITAIVLAGGAGTRLRAVVSDRPKVLAEVAGRPFITYLLDQVSAAGIRRVVLSTGYLAEQFLDAVGTSYGGMELEYAEEPTPLGTGGAIRFAGRLVDTPSALIMNGDSYVEADLAGYIQWHQREANDVSLLLVRVADSSRYGTVHLDEQGQVSAFLEKRAAAGPGLINAGVYVVKSRLFDEIPAGKCSLEAEVLPEWIQSQRVRGLVTEGRFIDIGVPEDYQRSQQFMESLSRA